MAKSVKSGLKSVKIRQNSRGGADEIPKRTQSETKKLAREAVAAAHAAEKPSPLALKVQGELMAARRAIADAIEAIEDGRRGDALKHLRSVPLPVPTRRPVPMPADEGPLVA